MKTKLEDLIKTLKSLRNPEGCDWNRAQTHETLIPYLLEETYEVIEAIENKDFELLKEELGDLLLHVIFQAELADEKKQFNIYFCHNFIVFSKRRKHFVGQRKRWNYCL